MVCWFDQVIRQNHEVVPLGRDIERELYHPL